MSRMGLACRQARLCSGSSRRLCGRITAEKRLQRNRLFKLHCQFAVPVTHIWRCETPAQLLWLRVEGVGSRARVLGFESAGCSRVNGFESAGCSRVKGLRPGSLASKLQGLRSVVSRA
eukprot:3056874-Rhodomonas_salina.1